jgi:hypothetical protein
MMSTAPGAFSSQQIPASDGTVRAFPMCLAPGISGSAIVRQPVDNDITVTSGAAGEDRPART